MRPAQQAQTPVPDGPVLPPTLALRSTELQLHRLNDVANSLGPRQSVNVGDFHAEQRLNLAHDLHAFDAVDAKLALQIHVHLDH
eukprot:CAMPEP_0184519198 /NCGR_PEP_ID=MMETSP0198_2-20121128/6498_1 /TAXON_ID=1112570 /ORGANISM="Thraustochytrium sp., Strain LLF1b" /LENGTH=83 /DNA_ID=CAMNT_0026909697 /DNA_START=50 /DNA_END=302 /DNA_ORIENTATION=-